MLHAWGEGGVKGRECCCLSTFALLLSVVHPTVAIVVALIYELNVNAVLFAELGVAWGLFSIKGLWKITTGCRSAQTNLHA